jgi:hypothetical protein
MDRFETPAVICFNDSAATLSRERLFDAVESVPRRARHVPLSDGALSVLASMSREAGVDWTFANPETASRTFPFIAPGIRRARTSGCRMCGCTIWATALPAC